MKAFLLIILLLPGLKLLDYACEQSARLDASSSLTMYNTGARRSDMYIHERKAEAIENQKTIKTSHQNGWVIKGLVVSLVIIISIGLVRERPRG
ncbi:hypothetical protein [Larkinella terrae]|uniref:Uncharacterized protein n=1 Tax=Larkinella terrae TaxID=2025311 RepID=A0A7K0ETV1_9BACT|nr:hypothetical protein [Larkinella terrae]MRS65233.1 hypothetical protein [Larkinella terrae]